MPGIYYHTRIIMPGILLPYPCYHAVLFYRAPYYRAPRSQARTPIYYYIITVCLLPYIITVQCYRILLPYYYRASCFRALYLPCPELPRPLLCPVRIAIHQRALVCTQRAWCVLPRPVCITTPCPHTLLQYRAPLALQRRLSPCLVMPCPVVSYPVSITIPSLSYHVALSCPVCMTIPLLSFHFVYRMAYYRAPSCQARLILYLHIARFCSPIVHHPSIAVPRVAVLCIIESCFATPGMYYHTLPTMLGMFYHCYHTLLFYHAPYFRAGVIIPQIPMVGREEGITTTYSVSTLYVISRSLSSCLAMRVPVLLCPVLPCLVLLCLVCVIYHICTITPCMYYHARGIIPGCFIVPVFRCHVLLCPVSPCSVGFTTPY